LLRAVRRNGSLVHRRGEALSDRLTQERIAKNDAAFREANENIRDVADEQGLTVPPVPFICECGDLTCTKVVRMTLDAYGHVRSNDRWFLIAERHEAAQDSAVLVEQRDGYLIVEKTGHAGEVAERLAPDSGRGAGP
jgi:hypothetical protein